MPRLLLLTLLAACSSRPSAPRPDDIPPPPTTRTVDQVDDLHGKAIHDPFRWLEDQDSEEVLAWAHAQQERTESVLSRVRARGRIRTRLAELWSFEQRGVPLREAGMWVWSVQAADQDKPVWYAGRNPRAVPGSESGPVVLVDPNLEETASVGTVSLSPKGRYVAVSFADSGSDWRTWRVYRTADGVALEDEVRWSKFSDAAWLADESGFFYLRYPAPQSGQELAAPNRNPQLCFHEIGTAADRDLVVYERPDEPTWSFAADVTRDGRHVVLTVRNGTDRRRRVAVASVEKLFDALVSERAAGEGAEPVERPLERILWRFDASWQFLGKTGEEFVFLTDHGAPRRRIVAVDPSKPQPEVEADADEGGEWAPRVIVPEGPDRIADARLAGGELVLTVLRDASHRILRFGLDGRDRGEVELPSLGTVADLTGGRDRDDVWFRFESFFTPPTLYSLDLVRGELDTVFRPELPLMDDELAIAQPSFESHDKARLVAFLLRRRDRLLDADNRTWLYGYGGFDISLTPRFQPDRVVWVERGGVYVQPTLRGGGEFGEAWHRDGMLDRKQNVFEDLYSTAEFLIRNRYTRPARLGVSGRSNGGLLAAAALTQRPELFAAAIPEVGVLDMLRFHRFTIGAAWIPEYGDPDDADAFEWLHGYSPLHNLRDGVAYPATLVMTSDHDDRVVPAHSLKFAAAMQAYADNPAPVLLRVTPSQGHGAGRPRSVQIDEAADRIAFLEWILGS